MRFLTGNALPRWLAESLVASGHTAVHVRDYAIQAVRDEEILTVALAEDRIIISADTDFGTILAALKSDRPSFVLFREPDLLNAEDYAGVLIPCLPSLELELAGGCVAVFRSGRLRIRRLPILPV